MTQSHKQLPVILVKLCTTLVFLAIFGVQSIQCQDPATESQTRLAPAHADVPYGPHSRNILDLYLPDASQPTPLVLYIHGGGFHGGDKNSIRQRDLQSFLQAGYAVAAVNYRLTDTAPAPAAYLDCGRALQFLRYHAEKWNLNPLLVASTGSSAGAGTSMWLAFHDDLAQPASDDPVARQSTRLTCVAVSDGQSSYDPRFAERIGIRRPNFDAHPFFLPFYDLTQDQIDTPEAYRRYEQMAPITYLSADDPPALLNYGYANVPVDANSSMGLIVHHPLLGIALKEQMDKLGIECIVQYPAGPNDRQKVRHNSDKPIVSPVEFITSQFDKAEFDGKRESGTP